MLPLVGLSFDDTLVEQYKWARMLSGLGLRAVFYVSPGHLREGKLQQWMLPQMREWGHIIGNHTWEHATVKADGWNAISSIDHASGWLNEHGYDWRLLALPCGVRGGGWTDETIWELRRRGYALRDVRFDATEERPLPAAWESTAPLSGLPLDLRYFHGNHNTSDASLVAFAEHVAHEVSCGRVQIALPGKDTEEWLPSL